MYSKISVTPPNWPYATLPCGDFCRTRASVRRQLEGKYRFKIVCQSLGDRWKLNDIDPVQEQLSSWLSLFKTRVFLNEMPSPLVKTSRGKSPDPEYPIDE